MLLFEVIGPQELHHATSLKNAVRILRSGFLRPGTSADAYNDASVRPFISFSRDKRLRYGGMGEEGRVGTIQFVFDRDVLKHRAVVKPATFVRAPSDPIPPGGIDRSQSEERADRRISIADCKKVQVFVPKRDNQRGDEKDFDGKYAISLIQIIQQLAHNYGIPVEFVPTRDYNKYVNGWNKWYDHNDPLEDE